MAARSGSGARGVIPGILCPMAKPVNAPEVAVKVLARNRRARHEYHVEETLEAGLVLAGSEVKSIRDGKVTLVDAFADIDKGEAWLHQMDIGVYAFSHQRNHEPRQIGRASCRERVCVPV